MFIDESQLKFKIGDTVYVIMHGEISEGKVYSINISKFSDAEYVTFRVWFHNSIGGQRDYSEERIFSSKQALIASLIGNCMNEKISKP